MSRRLPVFKCVALHVKLSVEACSATYEKRENPVCRRCEVGAEHARGRTPERWPESRGGGAIERTALERFDRIPPRIRRAPAA